MDFASWLQEELKNRDWTQADLARNAGVHRQVISTYINRQRASPDEAVLRKIARAFKVPPEQVFRAAGALPPKPEIDEQIEQILHEVAQMPKEDQAEVLAFIRMKNELRSKKGS